MIEASYSNSVLVVDKLVMKVKVFAVVAIHFVEIYNVEKVVAVLVEDKVDQHAVAYVVKEDHVDELGHHNNRAVAVVGVHLVAVHDDAIGNNLDVNVVEQDYDHKHDGQVDNNDVWVVVVLVDVYL